MFEGYEELNTQDVEWMQEVIRTLLAQTFLPERKYDKKYGRMMPDRMYDFSDRHLEFLTVCEVEEMPKVVKQFLGM